MSELRFARSSELETITVVKVKNMTKVFITNPLSPLGLAYSKLASGLKGYEVKLLPRDFGVVSKLTLPNGSTVVNLLNPNFGVEDNLDFNLILPQMIFSKIVYGNVPYNWINIFPEGNHYPDYAAFLSYLGVQSYWKSQAAIVAEAELSPLRILNITCSSERYSLTAEDILSTQQDFIRNPRVKCDSVIISPSARGGAEDAVRLLC